METIKTDKAYCVGDFIKAMSKGKGILTIITGMVSNVEQGPQYEITMSDGQKRWISPSNFDIRRPHEWR